MVNDETKTYPKILVAVDGSEYSRRAFQMIQCKFFSNKPPPRDREHQLIFLFLMHVLNVKCRSPDVLSSDLVTIRSGANPTIIKKYNYMICRYFHYHDRVLPFHCVRVSIISVCYFQYLVANIEISHLDLFTRDISFSPKI